MTRLARGGGAATIDVLVVCDPNRSRLHDAADSAEATLQREVNIRVVSEDLWKSGNDPFLATLKSQPLWELELTREKTISQPSDAR